MQLTFLLVSYFYIYRASETIYLTTFSSAMISDHLIDSIISDILFPSYNIVLNRSLNNFLFDPKTDSDAIHFPYAYFRLSSAYLYQYELLSKLESVDENNQRIEDVFQTVSKLLNRFVGSLRDVEESSFSAMVEDPVFENLYMVTFFSSFYKNICRELQMRKNELFIRFVYRDLKKDAPITKEEKTKLFSTLNHDFSASDIQDIIKKMKNEHQNIVVLTSPLIHLYSVIYRLEDIKYSNPFFEKAPKISQTQIISCKKILDELMNIHNQLKHVDFDKNMKNVDVICLGLKKNEISGAEYYLLDKLRSLLKKFWQKVFSDSDDIKDFEILQEFESLCRVFFKYWSNETLIEKFKACPQNLSSELQAAVQKDRFDSSLENEINFTIEMVDEKGFFGNIQKSFIRYFKLSQSLSKTDSDSFEVCLRFVDLVYLQKYEMIDKFICIYTKLEKFLKHLVSCSHEKINTLKKMIISLFLEKIRAEQIFADTESILSDSDDKSVSTMYFDEECKPTHIIPKSDTRHCRKTIITKDDPNIPFKFSQKSLCSFDDLQIVFKDLELIFGKSQSTISRIKGVLLFNYLAGEEILVYSELLAKLKNAFSVPNIVVSLSLIDFNPSKDIEVDTIYSKLRMWIYFFKSQVLVDTLDTVTSAECSNNDDTQTISKKITDILQEYDRNNSKIELPELRVSDLGPKTGVAESNNANLADLINVAKSPNVSFNTENFWIAKESTEVKRHYKFDRHVQSRVLQLCTSNSIIKHAIVHRILPNKSSSHGFLSEKNYPYFRNSHPPQKKLFNETCKIAVKTKNLESENYGLPAHPDHPSDSTIFDFTSHSGQIKKGRKKNKNNIPKPIPLEEPSTKFEMLILPQKKGLDYKLHESVVKADQLSSNTTNDDECDGSIKLKDKIDIKTTKIPSNPISQSTNQKYSHHKIKNSAIQVDSAVKNNEIISDGKLDRLTNNQSRIQNLQIDSENYMENEDSNESVVCSQNYYNILLSQEKSGANLEAKKQTKHTNRQKKRQCIDDSGNKDPNLKRGDCKKQQSSILDRGDDFKHEGATPQKPCYVESGFPNLKTGLPQPETAGESNPSKILKDTFECIKHYDDRSPLIFSEGPQGNFSKRKNIDITAPFEAKNITMNPYSIRGEPSQCTVDLNLIENETQNITVNPNSIRGEPSQCTVDLNLIESETQNSKIQKEIITNEFASRDLLHSPDYRPSDTHCEKSEENRQLAIEKNTSKDISQPKKRVRFTENSAPIDGYDMILSEQHDSNILAYTTENNEQYVGQALNSSDHLCVFHQESPISQSTTNLYHNNVCPDNIFLDTADSVDGCVYYSNETREESAVYHHAFSQLLNYNYYHPPILVPSTQIFQYDVTQNMFFDLFSLYGYFFVPMIPYSRPYFDESN